MNKIKRFISFLLISVLLLSITGCGAKNEEKKETVETAKEETTITITDHADNEVVLPKDIKKIAVCGIFPLPSVLSVFFDSADKIIAMDENSMTAAKNSLLSNLYPEILNADTSISKGGNINTEALMKLSPDVVFYSESDKAIGEQLRNAGFKAVAISVNKWNYNAIETLNNWIDLLSKIFPENDKSKKVRSYSENIYDMVQSKVRGLSDSERKKVFFLFQYTDSMISTSGKNFFGNWWAEAIGAKNVAAELTNDNSVQVNLEQVYSWNPEIIFMTNFNKFEPESLYTNAVGNYDWSKIAAVSKKQVYKMPLGMYRSYTPGVDTPVTLLWLAKTTYPEIYKDIDITEETKKYYKEVFDITLSDEQAQGIFKPVSSAGASF